jgi:hypothetical protein
MKKYSYLLSAILMGFGFQNVSYAQSLTVVSDVSGAINIQLNCQDNKSSLITLTRASSMKVFENNDLEAMGCQNDDDLDVAYGPVGSLDGQCSGISYNPASMSTSEYQITLNDDGSFSCPVISSQDKIKKT